MKRKILSIIMWTVISALGGIGFGALALSKGEQVSSFWLLTAALCTYAVGYRFYSRFIARKIMGLDDRRATPAELHNDGKDFVPTNKWVLYGHHFAAIAGAGPLVGPTLAAQMGYLPGTIWIIVGVVLGGAVQDFIILFGSMRRNGKSLGQIAKEEIGPIGGVLAMIGILAIMVILIAVLALVVVNALTHSPWATFTIAMTLPIAILMGLYMRYFRPGRVLEASVIGIVLLFASLYFGQAVAESPTWAPLFDYEGTQLAIMIIIYGFIASVLPVWFLLAPRDYLSSFLKIGTIAFLAIGIIFTLPNLQMPALTKFIDGTGPVFTGNLFPFLFITIACGAISGFHALVASGTTPKMIIKESDAPLIGYGAMLTESMVAIMALIAACVLTPGLYFAVNAPTSAIGADAVTAAATITNTYGFPVTPELLTETAKDVGETSILSRTGGAPSFALGMAHIFSGFIGGKTFMAFWYHFAILFEAVFILTTIDAGTRVGRFMVQDMLGNVFPKLKRMDYLPGNLIGSAAVTAGWGYFLYQGVIDPLGGIKTLWPLFGIANQMLAAIAFVVGTTLIIKMGKARYAWVTLFPMAWLSSATLYAAWQKIFSNDITIGFWAHANKFKEILASGSLPKGVTSVEVAEKMIFNDRVDTIVCAIFLIITIAIIIDGVRLWLSIANGKKYELKEEPFVLTKRDHKGDLLA
ncbi:carbon starvation CstA family protein [Brevibacillus laterosporus]|uniref:carbon starvation CstA family protein n=1 Tax=Brevibacillus laterosporus TaxID=1465 RepID=UPI003D1D7159